MKDPKPSPNKVFGLILLITVAASLWYFDLPKTFIGFGGSLIFLLTMGIPDYLRLQKDLKSMNVIKVKAMRWYSAWLYPVMWIFLFYNKSFDFYSVSTLIMIAAYGTLETMRLYYTYYVISDIGIVVLDSHQVILKASEVTEIETRENSIAIHTKKFKNHLELKSTDVISPRWDKVLEQIRLMNSE